MPEFVTLLQKKKTVTPEDGGLSHSMAYKSI